MFTFAVQLTISLILIVPAMVVEIECLQTGSFLYVDQESDMFELLSLLLEMNDDYDPIDFRINIKGSIYNLRINFVTYKT